VHVHGLTWLQLAARLEQDGRIVLPLGSTEQHAYLSLGTDTIEVERIAVEAAEPLGVPVLPALPYGITPQLAAFPGSPSLRPETYAALLADILESLLLQGWRRILLLNGHVGNMVVRPEVVAWAAAQAPTGAGRRCTVRWHDWWEAPEVLAPMGGTVAGHASWVESFPWTRVQGVALPTGEKPPVALDELAPIDPREAKALLGDGSYGGAYDLGPERAIALHEAAVAAARAALVALSGE
jgi:creatinine amidohydrolase